VSKSDKQLRGERLGKNISKLIMCGDESNVESLLGDALANKVVIDLNMLCASVENWVDGQVRRTQVVAP
jgi:hypothetical protein